MFQVESSVLCFLRSFLILLTLLAGSQNVFAELRNAVLPDYALGSTDLVRIQVYDEQDLYLESRVSDKGTISYPFLGELKVKGLTPRQLEQLIATKLKGDYLINPKVSVDILEYRSVYINGEVASPGGFAFQPGITVRKAISLAGGFTDHAAEGKISVIHDNSPFAKSQPIRLDDFVQPGDILTVEESFF